MDKLFETLIKFWGSVGYLYYDRLVENNRTAPLSKVDKSTAIALLNTLHSNGIHDDSDIAKISDYDYELSNGYLKKDEDYEISEIVEMVSLFINEIFISKVFSEYLTSDNNAYFIKFIDINSFDNIDTDRWMSFSRNNSSNNSVFGRKVIIVRGDINYVPTNGNADLHEVLINSNDLLEIIDDKNRVTLLDDNILISVYNFFNDLCKNKKIDIPMYILNELRALEMYQGPNIEDYNLQKMYNSLLPHLGVMMKTFNYYKQ